MLLQFTMPFGSDDQKHIFLLLKKEANCIFEKVVGFTQE